MPLPDSFIQELTARNDVESVLGSYINLRRRGRTLVGLCPFHGEKTPSFTVYPETASFYCFGCGAGGDVITFVKRIENLDYLDAVKFLAERAGLKMPENDMDDTTSRLRRRILEANREAARFFHQSLTAPEGVVAREYYARRGYTPATIRRFGLGYAPDSFHALLDHMRKKGFRDEELTAAFLCKRSPKGNLYDIFRNRIIIPIIDIRGNVIAFGGRVLDDSKPKYVNTSDTLVFKKTENLFALNFAKATADQQLILCEGYMDVIALHQAGFQNAVAALGTSFTADHARLVARYTKEAVLIFDADGAGQKATRRAIDLLRGVGVDIRVVRIPDGKDPDEFIKKNGAERFRVVLTGAANDVEYQLIELGAQHDLTASDGQVAYLRAAAKILAGLQSTVERDVYAGRLASQLKVSKDALLREVDFERKRRQKQQVRHRLSDEVKRSEQATEKANPQAAQFRRAASAEEALIGFLLLHPDRIESTAEMLAPDEMVTDFNRQLYCRLIDLKRQGAVADLPCLSAVYDEGGMAYIARMLQEARDRSPDPAEAVNYAEVIKKERKLQALQKDPAEMSAEEMQEILQKLRDMKS